MRIVSLVPSLTELCYHLELDAHMVGVTRFCIRPKEKTKDVTTVGGTKSIKINRILALQPDLVIANKEENTKEEIETLATHCNVWITDITTLEDAINVVRELGRKTHTPEKANTLIAQIRQGFAQLRQLHLPLKKVAYLIWNNPIMLAGNHTFIQQMLNELNWQNVLTDKHSRYPEITETELNQLQPDLILLSSEPYPFTEKHRVEFQKKFSQSQVILVDGEMFSWYGSRLLYAPAYFEQLLLESNIR